MEKVERDPPQHSRTPEPLPDTAPGVTAKGCTFLPPAKKASGGSISPRGACPCHPASSSSLGSPQLWRHPPLPALPSQPRPWKLLSPSAQLGANSSGAAWEVIPQNCSGEGRAASPPLTALLPGSPCPLEAAQRRSLPAICCQRLGIETKYKPST